MRRPRSERGATVVLTVAVASVGFALVLALTRVGAARTATARAETAADAAALAAADALALGAGPGTARSDAAATAADNGAELLDCSCGGSRVVVTVAVPVLGRRAVARAAAELRGPTVPSPGSRRWADP